MDSSEWAFYQASQAAFAEVSEDGIWQLLEPVMSVEVNSPNEFTSGIFGLITGRWEMVVFFAIFHPNLPSGPVSSLARMVGMTGSPWRRRFL